MRHKHDWLTGNHAFQCACGVWEKDPLGPPGGCDCHPTPPPPDLDLIDGNGVEPWFGRLRDAFLFAAFALLAVITPGGGGVGGGRGKGGPPPPPPPDKG